MPRGTFPASDNHFHPINWPCGPDNSAITQEAWFSMLGGGANFDCTGEIYFTASKPDGKGHNYTILHQEHFDLEQNVAKGWHLPANTDGIFVNIDTATQEVSWALELRAK
jgi:hypothetical protein